MNRPFAISLAVALGSLLSFAFVSLPQSAAQRVAPKAASEYKVVWSPISNTPIRMTKKVEGKDMDIEHSPRTSAEPFNALAALAAEGWEYVGPIAPTGKQNASDADGVMSLFKKAR